MTMSFCLFVCIKLKTTSLSKKKVFFELFFLKTPLYLLLNYKTYLGYEMRLGMFVDSLCI